MARIVLEARDMVTPFAAVLVVLTSTPTIEPAPSVVAPTWSLAAGIGLTGVGWIGAGVTSLGGLSFMPGGVGGLGGLGGGLGFSPSLSLERRFSHRFALGLGLEGSVSTVSIVGSTTAPMAGSATVGLSPRFTVSPESWPVALTFFATALVGAGSSQVWFLEQWFEGRQLQAGVSGGLALEKLLTDRLALRVQAQLVRATLVRSWQTTPALLGDGTYSASRSVGSFFNAGFAPSPSIELRLYL